jgi:hypothetical protein
MLMRLKKVRGHNFKGSIRCDYGKILSMGISNVIV